PITKELIGQNFTKLVFFKISVELGNKANAFTVAIFGYFLSLVAQASVHLLPKAIEIQFAFFGQFFIFSTCGVYQLYFAASLRTFIVGYNPDVGANARVVKELVG